MIRRAVASVGLAVAGATLLCADTLPDGEYMFGGYLWPQSHLPHYVTVITQAGTSRLEFSSTLPINLGECVEGGLCLYQHAPVTFRADVSNGTVQLFDVAIEPDADATLDYRDLSLRYIGPFLAYLQNADVGFFDTGFTVTNLGLTHSFFATSAIGRSAIRAYPPLVGRTAYDLRGCAVHALAPSLQEPDLTDPFVRTLFAQGWASRLNAPYRFAVSGDGRPEDPELQDFEFWSGIRMFIGVSRHFDTSQIEQEIEGFWSRRGETILGGDRAAFEAILGGFGTGLADWIRFGQHVFDDATETSAQAVCADPTLGFRYE